MGYKNILKSVVKCPARSAEAGMSRLLHLQDCSELPTSNTPAAVVTEVKEGPEASIPAGQQWDFLLVVLIKQT